MIVFRNPGLIDLDTVRTMGVNVKTSPTAFGHFGTGMKFAIATVLRGGGSVVIYRGTESHDLTTERRRIRDVEFDLVCLDGEPIGFTTELGRNWEPWMVLREFGCNALDEGGDFWQTDVVDCYSEEESTTFEVHWDALDEVWAERDTVFCPQEAEVLIETAQLQVLEGHSDYLFYRGIRAYKMQKPSVVTYNILSLQTLSEDRSIAHIYYPMGEIRRTWLECTDKVLLWQVLVPEAACFEDTIDYTQTERTATREFLDTILDARTSLRGDAKGRINKSAVSVLHKSIRSGKEDGIGYTSGRYLRDEFGAAIEGIGEIFSEDELRLDGLKLVLVEDDEVRGDAMAMLEDGRLYIARSLLRQGRRAIAQTILPLILELRSGDLDELIQLVVPALLRRHLDFRTDSAIPIDEEPPQYSVADALLVGMDVVGEEFPARPSDL